MEKTNLKKYDVYVSYSHKDRQIVDRIVEKLRMQGITVFYGTDILPGMDLTEYIGEIIISCKVFLPVVTQNYKNSKWCMRELALASEEAFDRSKLIIPVIADDVDMQGSLHFRLHHSLRNITFDAQDEKNIDLVSEKTALMIRGELGENTLYERLSEYLKANAKDQATRVLCEIIPSLCERIPREIHYAQKKNLYMSLLDLLDKLLHSYTATYDTEGEELAKLKMGVMSRADTLVSDAARIACDDDLLFVCFVLRILYYDREIRRDSVDATTHGDVFQDMINPFPVEEYIERQAPYTERYNRLSKEQTGQDNSKGYTESELEFIGKSAEYIYLDRSPLRHSFKMQITPKTKEEELLSAVASFMSEGNRVLDLISENSGAEDFLRCLITSYERLKAYCEVIGESKICAQCIDRIVELRSRLEREDFRKANEVASSGLKTLLGITVPSSGKYDLFISHKREDSDIAEDMYYFLKKNLKEAFYDRFSLPEMGETQYRRSIMQALDGSSNFVVIFSDLAYLESKWVSLEMEIFLSEMDEGRKKNAKFLLVCTNKAYDKIISSNKEVLPIEYRRFEIIRVEEYKGKILSYIN